MRKCAARRRENPAMDKDLLISIGALAGLVVLTIAVAVYMGEPIVLTTASVAMR
jgi:hypothetical protein